MESRAREKVQWREPGPRGVRARLAAGRGVWTRGKPGATQREKIAENSERNEGESDLRLGDSNTFRGGSPGESRPSPRKRQTSIPASAGFSTSGTVLLL